MKYILSTFLAATLIFSGFSAKADQILTEMDVNNFLSTLTDVKGLTDNMSEDSRSELMGHHMQEMQDSEFSPYEHGVSVLKEKYPGDYTNLFGVVTQYGFSSPEEWAQTGDDMMAAYMNVRVGDQLRQSIVMMSQVPSGSMALMPPEALQQMERSKSIVKELDAVPAENTELMKTHADKVDAAMQAMAE